MVMVITEALTLGVPVIATKTSGALEQIEDGVNGVLTDFDETDIAEKLGSFLAAPDALRRMREKLRGYAAKTNAGVLQSFHALLDARSAALAPGRRMLYVIDDINYCGGAHIATRSQMALLLAEGWDISVFPRSYRMSAHVALCQTYIFSAGSSARPTFSISAVSPTV